MAGRIKSGVLVANVVTTVVLDADYDRVEILNRDGAAEIWLTVDGAAPTVGGQDCECLPAAIGSTELPAKASGATTVKMISSGAPAYTVTGLA